MEKSEPNRKYHHLGILQVIREKRHFGMSFIQKAARISVSVYKTQDMDMSFHFDDETISKKDIVIVAAAGVHQIWAVCIDDVIWWKFKKYTAGTVVVIAGNGAEENRNNSYPGNAAFAQPSG